jgi:hypothetical protein
METTVGDGSTKRTAMVLYSLKTIAKDKEILHSFMDKEWKIQCLCNYDGERTAHEPKKFQLDFRKN